MEFTEEEKERFCHIADEHSEQDGDELLILYAKRGLVSGYRWAVEVDLDQDQEYWSVEYHLEHERLDVVKMMIDGGYPVGHHTMLYAIQVDSLEGVKTLKDCGCPWDKESLMKKAEHLGDQEIIDWVKSL